MTKAVLAGSVVTAQTCRAGASACGTFAGRIFHRFGERLQIGDLGLAGWLHVLAASETALSGQVGQSCGVRDLVSNGNGVIGQHLFDTINGVNRIF